MSEEIKKDDVKPEVVCQVQSNLQLLRIKVDNGYLYYPAWQNGSKQFDIAWNKDIHFTYVPNKGK